MGRLKTKVINTTDKNIILKEGTGRIYSFLKTLPPKEFYNIIVDPNATYREYWCAVKDDDPNALILSSDDCQEYAVVRISENAGSYSWDGDLRPHKEGAKDELDANSNSEGTSNESFFGKIMSKLGFVRRETATVAV